MNTKKKSLNWPNLYPTMVHNDDNIYFTKLLKIFTSFRFPSNQLDCAAPCFRFSSRQLAWPDCAAPYAQFQSNQGAWPPKWPLRFRRTPTPGLTFYLWWTLRRPGVNFEQWLRQSSAAPHKNLRNFDYLYLHQ